MSSFADLPWDLIAKISVTCASLVVILFLASRVLYDIARRAFNLTVLAFALVGCSYVYQLLRDHQSWGLQLTKLNAYLAQHHPGPSSYLDQANALVASVWERFVSA
jgi:hypothetical protein